MFEEVLAIDGCWGRDSQHFRLPVVYVVEVSITIHMPASLRVLSELKKILTDLGGKFSGADVGGVGGRMEG